MAEPQIHIVAKSEIGDIEAWRPKDIDSRVVSVPTRTVDLLSRMQSDASEGSVYAFLTPERVAWIRNKRDTGTWTEGQDVVNNLDKNFKRIARMAGVPDVSLHDLRRSCISNWARKLAAPVVQQLAGHSDIKTTMRYYVTVRKDDLALAREATSEALSLAQTNCR